MIDNYKNKLKSTLSEKRYKHSLGVCDEAVKLAPGMMGSLLIGRQIGTGGYVSAGIIAGVAVVLCVLCVIFRKRFTGLLNKGYDKLMKM